jgi:hypothetical protein
MPAQSQITDAGAPALAPSYDRAPFDPGTGEWQGVVMVEKDRRFFGDQTCRVRSARRIELSGMRMIVTRIKYSAVSRYFTSEVTKNYVYVHAEAKHGHIELYGKASMKEFFTLHQLRLT